MEVTLTRLGGAEEQPVCPVRFGTALERAALPEHVAVTLADGSGAAADVVWTWSAYRADLPGDYPVRGTLFAPGTANPGDIHAVQIIRVKPKGMTTPPDKTALDRACQGLWEMSGQIADPTRRAELDELLTQAERFYALTGAVQHDVDVQADRLTCAIIEYTQHIQAKHLEPGLHLFLLKAAEKAITARDHDFSCGGRFFVRRPACSLSIENRKTHTCHPSYNTIAAVTGLAKNTAMKSINTLLEMSLIAVEHSSYFDKRGMKWTGNNLYTILPMQMAVDRFHQRQLYQLELDAERRRVRKRQETHDHRHPRAVLCAPPAPGASAPAPAT